MKPIAVERDEEEWGEPQTQRLPALPWLLAAYPVLWLGGYWISNAYWFLPAGLRVAALLMLRPRHWWLLGVVEVAAIALLEVQRSNGYQTVSGAALGMLGPFLTFALGLGYWRYRNRALLPQSPQALARLLSIGMACCAVVAVLLIGMRVAEGHVPMSAAPELAFSYMIGDFVGILCVAPLLLQIGSPRAGWREPQVWRLLLSTLLPVTLLLFLVARWQPNATPYVALFTMVPPVLLAYRTGWRGAALAITGASAAVYYASVGAVDATTASLLQMYLAIVGGVSILLGGWTGLELRLRERLQLGNAELAEANRHLNAQSEAMRALGMRLVNAQENERRRIRADLRSELSQQISALSGQLALMVRQVDKPELLAQVDTLRTHVQAIRDAADECVERLHPQGLSRQSLEQSLTMGTLHSCLEAAGISYSVRCVGDEKRLGVLDRVTVYRVVQHVVATSLRYSDALSLQVSLTLPNGQGDDWIEVNCVLSCRAPLLLDAVEGEADILALRDRMLAVGGRVDITPVGEHGLSFVALFPLQDDVDDDASLPPMPL